MLTTEAIEKAIEMYENGATEATVAEGTAVSPGEAKVVADALYLGETERLLVLFGLLKISKRLCCPETVSDEAGMYEEL
jgi:hypothetical protein